MFTDPKAWRRQVENRLVELRQDIRFAREGTEEYARLEHRIRMLREELRRLDEEENEHGTQWIDPETGRAADM